MLFTKSSCQICEVETSPIKNKIAVIADPLKTDGGTDRKQQSVQCFPTFKTLLFVSTEVELMGLSEHPPQARLTILCGEGFLDFGSQTGFILIEKSRFSKSERLF